MRMQDPIGVENTEKKVTPPTTPDRGVSSQSPDTLAAKPVESTSSQADSKSISTMPDSTSGTKESPAHENSGIFSVSMYIHLNNNACMNDADVDVKSPKKCVEPDRDAEVVTAPTAKVDYLLMVSLAPNC